MIVIGIDPGLTGALALVKDGELVEVHDLPTLEFSAGKVKRKIDAVGLKNLLRDVSGRYASEGKPAVFLERVWSMTGQGVASVFSLGYSAGLIEGVIMAAGYQLYTISPSEWSKTMRAGSEKSFSVAAATARFPDMAHHWSKKKDHNRCDAALIATFGYLELA